MGATVIPSTQRPLVIHLKEHANHSARCEWMTGEDVRRRGMRRVEERERGKKEEEGEEEEEELSSPATSLT